MKLRCDLINLVLKQLKLVKQSGEPFELNSLVKVDASFFLDYRRTEIKHTYTVNIKSSRGK